MSGTRGWLAEYDSVDALVSAARGLVEDGWRDIEAFTPFPVEELDAVLPRPRNPVPAVMLIAALIGAVGGYALQWWTAVVDYPWLVGGKPMHSWPTFLPVAFELAVLFSAFAGFFALLWTSGLPRLHHPVFGAADFRLASRDRFFLMLGSDDQPGNGRSARKALERTDPVHLHEVPEEDDDAS